MTQATLHITLVCCLLLLIGGSRAFIVDVNTDSVLFEVSDKFLSMTIDCALLNSTPKWQAFDFKNPRLTTLLKGLSPMYLRLGGTPADWTVFSNADFNMFKQLNTTPPMLTLTTDDWDNLVNLTRSAGIRFLYDLNLQLRYGVQWDPTNAISLMQYLQAKGYGDNLDFEMGNEPGYYSENGGRIKLTGSQIAQDFEKLKQVLLKYPNFKNSILVGPDSVGMFHWQHQVLQEFVQRAGSFVSAVTWHHYYFYGPTATVDTYLDPSHFDNLAKSIQIVQNAVQNSSTPSLPVWIGETNDAWGAGTLNISDRFVNGFLWLEKLGLGAKMGLGVIMRQTFYGHNYGAIGNDLYPNPDYWLSYVYKQLVGTQVLDVNSNMEYGGGNRYTMPGYDPSERIRVYAHCTKPSGTYFAGSVTVFALNMNKNVSELLTFKGDLAYMKVDVYLMTADGPEGLTSRYVAMNGIRMMMIDDKTLPNLKPVQQQAIEGIQLPPTSYGFFVFRSANIKACLSSKYKYHKT